MDNKINKKELIKKLKKTKNIFLIGITLVGISIFLIFFISSFSNRWIGFESHYWTIIGGTFLWFGGLFMYSSILNMLAGEELNSHGKVFRRLEMMLNSSRESIKIITGTMNSKAYVDDKGVQEALKKKIRDGVNIKIISGSKIDKKTLEVFSPLTKQYQNFSIVKLAIKNPYPHGMLVDDNILRIEEPHRIGELLRSNSCYKGQELVNDFFRESFEEMEKTVVDYPENKSVVSSQVSLGAA